MKRRFRADQVLIAAVMGAAGWGCRATEGGPRSPHEGVPPPTVASQRTARTGGLSSRNSYHVVQIAFEVLRIQLPMEGLQHSRKIWNHVDTLRVGPEMAGRLARNGLRVGVLSPGAWPAIQTILHACDAVLQKERTPPQYGLPLTIQMGAIRDAESIFSYGPGNRLVGKTFQRGKKLISIEYRVHAELGGSVDLQANLEIRHDRGVMTWERRDGVVKQVPAVDRHLYPALSAPTTLNPGEALLIGPSESARNEYLVGSRFLMSHQDQGLYETLLCITPIPFQFSDGPSR